MTNEEIIEYTDKWRQDRNFDGIDCDDTVIEDNTLFYFVGSHRAAEYVRLCSFEIPEDFHTWDNEEQKHYLDEMYRKQLTEWVNDEDYFYEEIAVASGLGEADVDIVKRVISNHADFCEALEEIRSKI